jgi:hypothetical protein
MNHRDIFFTFIKDCNREGIRYLLLRGFAHLPDLPDTDIDFVVHPDDWQKFIEIALRHLERDPGISITDFGYGEWAQMLYYPLFTPGPADHAIPNERFRVDCYSSLFFSSPAKNFTSKWTVPKPFFDYVIISRLFHMHLLENGERVGPYYVPNELCEIVLLVLRDVLDLRGQWKEKHINRINVLLPLVTDEFLKGLMETVLPNSDEIVDALRRNDYDVIFNLAMGIK